MKKYIIFILLFSLLGCSSCDKEEDCKVDYHLEIPVKLSPALEIYQIGDTINVSIMYNTNEMLNLNTNEYIETIDMDLGIAFLFGKFDSINLEDGLDFIDIDSITGDLSRQYLVGISILNLIPSSDNNKKEMTFGIILKEAGNFSLEFSSLFDVSREVIVINTNCDEKLRISWATNNKLERNFELYNNLRPDDGTTLEGYAGLGGFSFKVEE